MAFSHDCLDTIGVCPNRLRRLCIGEQAEGELCLDIYDLCSGQPIDLTKYGIPEGSSSSSSSSILSHWSSSSGSCLPNGEPKHGVEIVLKPHPAACNHWEKMAVVKSVEDAQVGHICIDFDKRMTRTAGVWCAMALVWEHGVLRMQYPFYVDITPNLAVYHPYGGPLHFAEIRLSVRDICPEMNFLIDQVEFKDEELAWAMHRPIDQWNETPPPVTIFSYTNFPFRYHWLEATVAELLFMTAQWMRRNDLDYSAAGLTVADTKKWPDYWKMAQERRLRWETWMKNKKIEINLSQAYATQLGYRAAPYR
jgi:hypothetical protein